jgi:hydroxyacylglutathione hydrolase
MDLKSDNVKIYGPINEKEKIPGIDVSLAAGDAVSFGTSTAQIIDVGGHTKGHIAYYFPQENVVFVGDSLFSLGCGRMFEGTPHQFWESLNRLRSLPDNTLIYWYVFCEMIDMRLLVDSSTCLRLTHFTLTSL